MKEKRSKKECKKKASKENTTTSAVNELLTREEKIEKIRALSTTLSKKD